MTRILLLIALLGLMVVPPAARAGDPYTLSGKVVEVADGDTLTLIIGIERHRIRLASIDAPETRHGSDKPGQPFAQASRKSLAELVAGKTVSARCFEKDRFGRDVCDIEIDGTTANRLQVKGGMAWANQQASGKYLRDKSILELESEARKAGLGIWSGEKAVAPWIWRSRCWKEGKC